MRQPDLLTAAIGAGWTDATLINLNGHICLMATCNGTLLMAQPPAPPSWQPPA
ncbi:MAG: hypothetical protein R3C14_40510 [Caldilineaceae bacterium]